MKGSAIAATLQDKLSSSSDSLCYYKREKQILDHVIAGNYVPITWHPITIDQGPVRATIYVSGDALRLGEPGDSFRVSMSACTAQRIADRLDAVLPTPKLLDEIWKQADIRVDPPVTKGSSGDMASMAWMLDHSKKVDARVQKYVDELYGGQVDSADLLLSNVGKHWVNSTWLSQSPTPQVDGGTAAENYGWYISAQHLTGEELAAKRHPVTPIPGVNIWQTPGHGHNNIHNDYSQNLILVQRRVTLCIPKALAGFGSIPGVVDPCVGGNACKLPDGSDGIKLCVDIYDLGNSSKDAVLINAGGSVLSMRQPGIPWEGGQNCDPSKNALVDCPPKPKQPPAPPYIPPHDDQTSPAKAGAGVAMAGIGGIGPLVLGALGFAGGYWAASEFAKRNL